MTYDELVEKVAVAMMESRAWPVVYSAGSADLLARTALAVVYEALIDPNNKMIRAAGKAMSPGKRPTPEWLPSSDKHAYRFMAMIEASPLKPQDTA